MGSDGNCHSTDTAARESRQLRGSMTTGTAEEPFDIAHPEVWEDYAQCFHFFLEAQDIADAGKKRSTFLSRGSPATFHLVKVLMAPAQLKDIPFETILASLRDHLGPKTPELAGDAKSTAATRQRMTSAPRNDDEITARKAPLKMFSSFEQAPFSNGTRETVKWLPRQLQRPSRVPPWKGCGKTRYFAKVCQSRCQRGPRGSSEADSRAQCYKNTHRANIAYCDDLAVTAPSTQSQPTKKLHVVVRINGAQCQVEVDYGSNHSIISVATA
ncbi:hypothetical protein HPB52_023369 [Rhipicephalus sanguineus]|uniref:Uncharacterized protein n=1 Tax=Rhipicephalus sanguineus TaxID=34632 RepID=A0A9D4QEZ6_RHISA|nr:hypothetical protein HPB52_023369 [Rhipicephalus sanguineus]